MGIFLGIDLGASALKACLIDTNGGANLCPIAQAHAPYPTTHPKPDQSEQNPADWLSAMQAALAALRAEQTQSFDAIEAISFSGGAHIGVLCDDQAHPLRPAIMWSDQRAHKQAAALANAGQAEDAVEGLAGNAPNATWTLPQLIWLDTHEPHIIRATEKLYFAKDWLAAQLIGVSAGDHHVTDKSEAVGSLMAGRDHKWNDALIALSGLTRSAIPRLVDIGSALGRVTPAAAAAFGLPLVPVYQGAIDTSMEWLCAAPLNATTASLKLASAGVVSFTTADETRFSPVSFYPHIIDGLYYHAAGMSDCMGAIDFVRQNFTPKLTAPAFEAAAAKAALGAEGLLFYPYLSGGRAPFWDATLTAELRGLTRGHDQTAIARAAYEGVGHVLTAIWHDMTDKLGQKPDALHILGGGGKSDFFCQMLADMLDVPIKRGREIDCAYATAMFAAAHHLAKQPKDMAHAAYQPQGEFTPDKSASAGYASSYQAFMTRHRRGSGL